MSSAATPAGSRRFVDFAALDSLLHVGETAAWIPGWEGLYAATDHGRIFSTVRPKARELKGDYASSDSRRTMRLQDPTAPRKLRTTVGRLILAAFEPKAGVLESHSPLVARHKDGNETNDALSNLEWGTALDNREDRSWHESVEMRAARGEHPAEIASSDGVAIQSIASVLDRKVRPVPRDSPYTLTDLLAEPGEVFRWVTDAEQVYAVSNLGRVFSLKGREPLELTPILGRTVRDDHRYAFTLRLAAGPRQVRRAILVAEAFLGPKPADGYVVRHKDDDPQNDRAANLAWGTQADNVEDMMQRGRSQTGERRTGAKLMDKQIPEIRERYQQGRDGVGPRLTVKDLAAEYGVSPGQIHNVVSGKQRNADGRTRQGSGTGRGATHYRASLDEATARRILAVADAITQGGGHPTPAKVRDQLQTLDATPPPLHTIKGIITGRSWRHLRQEPK